MTTALTLKKKVENILAPYSGTRFDGALPPTIDEGQFKRVLTTYLLQNPALIEKCTPQSLIASVFTLAQIGLAPDKVMGQAYIVPFGSVAQPIIGYKGLITLARQSGEVQSIAARAVYQRDKFDYAYGLIERLDHTPTTFKDKGPLTYVYAVAHFVNGGHHFEVLSRQDIEAIRDASYAGKTKGGLWFTHFDEMAKKTAIRRIAKYLPMEVQKADYVNEVFEERGKPNVLLPDGESIETENLERKADPLEASPDWRKLAQSRFGECLEINNEIEESEYLDLIEQMMGGEILYRDILADQFPSNLCAYYASMKKGKE